MIITKSYLVTSAIILVAGGVATTLLAKPPTSHEIEQGGTAEMDVSPAIAKMEKRQKTITDRVHVSAPLELDLQNGIDPAIEAVKNGIIVEASLEEVEAALAAAAATPDPEDDKQALDLKHRGSYRFFIGESVEEAADGQAGH